jgi:hypothetical protein
LFLRQRLANLKTFRQVTEKGGVFFNAQPSTSLSSPCDKGWCPGCVYGIKSMAQKRSEFILARTPREDIN